MNNTLVPEANLTAEESDLMLALNRAVLALSEQNRPVFRFDTGVNKGNTHLIRLLAKSNSTPVSYLLDYMVYFNHNQELYLNLCLTMVFHTQPNDVNGDESRRNTLSISPKQTAELIRRVDNDLLRSRLQDYATSLAQSIGTAAKMTEEYARRGIGLSQLKDGDKYHPIFDSATKGASAASYTSARLYAEGLLRSVYDQFVLRFCR